MQSVPLGFNTAQSFFSKGNPNATHMSGFGAKKTDLDDLTEE